MNWLYERDDACAYLNSYIEGASQDKSSVSLLKDVDVSHGNATQYSQPSCYRLTCDEGGEPSEVLVRIPGIIGDRNIGPFTRPLASNRVSAVRRLKQDVRLTGLGSHTFNAIESKFRDVESIFTNAVGPGQLELFSFDEYEGDYAVDMHTRYLTERNTVPSARHIPFPDAIDPLHILEEARGNRFVRTDDNVVEYCGRSLGTHGEPRFHPLGPASFQVGDVVEAYAAFVAYPLYDPDGHQQHRVIGHKLVLTLRTLVMLEAHFQEDAHDRRQKMKRRQPPREPTRSVADRRGPSLPTGRSLKRMLKV